MASLNTYAKLTAPQQFRPVSGQTVKFRLQYSHDLSTNYATIVIDGYNEDGMTGTKLTKYINTAIGGQWYEEFDVPCDDIGFTPDTDMIIHTAGKMQARVEIGSERDADGHVINPIFTSNTVLVDMLVMWDGDFYFADNNNPYNTVSQYISTSSNTPVTIFYIPRYDYGITGDADIQSYRFYLYDQNHKLIQDSEELYEWDSNIYGAIRYMFYGLRDDTTYYVRARITLNGGFVMYRPLNSGYIPIYVSYADSPTPSNRLKLSSVPDGVKMSLDLSGIPHTKITWSRTRYNVSEYLGIGEITDSSNIVTDTDKYAIPKTTYTYRAIVYNGNLIVGTYYNNITYESNTVKISDIFGCYTALGKITKHPISRNNRGQTLEAMDSVFPYNIINGAPNYDSGTVDGLFTDLDDDCNVIIDSDYLTAKADVLRAWLNNGHSKLLTYYTGESWIVAVSNIQTTDPDNNDVYNTTFNWTQIGDATKIDEYVRLGLVVNNM